MIRIDASSLVPLSTSSQGTATVSEFLFGGVDVNRDSHSAEAFLDAIDHLGLSTLRLPGGTMAEEGSWFTSGGKTSVIVNGGDQSVWATGDALASNFAYDLTYPDLMHPDILAARSDILGLSDLIGVAAQSNAALEIVVPVDRYSTFGSPLGTSAQDMLSDRFAADFSTFLLNLADQVQAHGKPERIILDFGNENLVWATKFPDEVLDPGEKFDAAAVQQAISSYFDLMKIALEGLSAFREAHPSLDLIFAPQLPSMNGQAGTTADPQDQFLLGLSELGPELTSQIDALRFHALSLSMERASNFENWYSDELARASKIIEAAKHEIGLQDDVLIIASEWSTDGAVSATDTSDPGRSLKAAASTIAAMSSFAEMGVDSAAAWGVAVPYMKDVQVSYWDEKSKTVAYTPRGEALRMAAEVLPGMTLITPDDYRDAWGTGLFNIQAFSDSSKIVLFLSANDLPPEASKEGSWVTFDVTNLPGGVSYAWAETLNTVSGTSGTPLIWNPLLDKPGEDEKGQSWLVIDGNTVSIALHNDFEMIRLVISGNSPGSAELNLVGDARLGFGIVDDMLKGGSGSDLLQGLTGQDTLLGGVGDDHLLGGSGADMLFGGAGHDSLLGGDDNDHIWAEDGNDVLRGESGDDYLFGGDGTDTLDGGVGNDVLYGGASNSDLRDVMFGGDGHDLLYGGAGNDSESGGYGNDTLFGDTGADTLIGNQGNDQLSGGPGADIIFGSDGDDWINGGFGSDRLNGGAGADTFFHLGVPDHGSDWIQDYSARQGDRLALGIPGATAEQLHVNYGYTVDAHGNPAGQPDIAEAFIVYQPTGQILWALVDGAAEEHIWVNLSGSIFDLCA